MPAAAGIAFGRSSRRRRETDMHSTEEIDRRLRLPAPDEPAILPTLALPSRDRGSLLVRGPVRAGRSASTFGLGSPRLVFVLLLLGAAIVGAIATGALRFDRLTKPLTSSTAFAARGLTLQLPEGWIRLTP